MVVQPYGTSRVYTFSCPTTTPNGNHTVRVDVTTSVPNADQVPPVSAEMLVQCPGLVARNGRDPLARCANPDDVPHGCALSRPLPRAGHPARCTATGSRSRRGVFGRLEHDPHLHHVHRRSRRNAHGSGPGHDGARAGSGLHR